MTHTKLLLEELALKAMVGVGSWNDVKLQLHVAFSNSVDQQLIDKATCGLIGVFQLVTVTFVLTFILEMLSLDTVKKIFQQPEGRSLYWSAVWKNVLNHKILGTAVYTTAAVLFCRDEPEDLNVAQFALNVLGIVVLHNFQYWYMHKAMHTPTLYKYHKFHHRFNVNVTPVVANAVTIVEYLLAYVIPFAVATALVRPTELQFRTAAYIISINNLFIHTPKLEELSEKYLPNMFVSTHKHMTHHKQNLIHYAAPVFDIDLLLKPLLGNVAVKES